MDVQVRGVNHEELSGRSASTSVWWGKDPRLWDDATDHESCLTSACFQARQVLPRWGKVRTGLHPRRLLPSRRLGEPAGDAGYEYGLGFIVLDGSRFSVVCCLDQRSSLTSETHCHRPSGTRR